MTIPKAHVFVLGALTRSPRTLSHAKYLARNGWNVTISGYVNSSEPVPDTNGLRILSIPHYHEITNHIFPSILSSLLKFIIIFMLLSWHLIRHCRSNVILLQNPPAVPTLLIFYCFVTLTGKRLIIDWHNYGYTIMELNTRRNSIVARIYRLLEVGFASWFLSKNDNIRHICVSKALKDDLLKHAIQATVFYDKPAEEFKPCHHSAAHKLFSRLQSIYPNFADPAGSCRRTRFTEITALPAGHGGSSPQWRRDRPALVVSSCSWTPDDDFNLVLDALEKYDVVASGKDAMLPHMLLVVTGRGPLKDAYARQIRAKNWTNVEVLMPWLEWADYTMLLGCADLAISVHRSSSGLDLPMKVVDFLGAGVPVLALSYPTLDELLADGEYGNHFTDSRQLFTLLTQLLRTDDRSVTIGSSQLASYRKTLSAHNEKAIGAQPYWEQVVLPIFYMKA